MAEASGETRQPQAGALAQAARLLKDQPRAALARATEIVERDRDNVDAVLLCAAALRRLGQVDAAARAEADAIRSAQQSPLLVEAKEALGREDFRAAENALRARLKAHPADVAAMRVLAGIGSRFGRLEDAERLLRRALGFAPSFAGAREDLADALARLGRRQEWLAELDRLVEERPGNPHYLNLKATAMNRIGRPQEAVAIFDEIIARFPPKPATWLYYGHNLRTVGRLQDAVTAYRRALEIDPAFGPAWWGLANLKTFQFDEFDIAAMERALEGEASPDDKSHIHFALGKAYEDRSQAEPSFRHYASGNAIKRAEIDYDADAFSEFVEAGRRLLTAEFFAQRAGHGDRSRAPIFIVGMHRAGSTLVEQILDSHPSVEGTAELPDLPLLARRLGAGPVGRTRLEYLDRLAELGAEEAAAMGADYLKLTSIQRLTTRPRFTDKLPSNWMHAGLIQLILPNARIVDVRRDPLDCCVSNFKQNYASGLAYAFDLVELGRFYRNYAAMMDHLDAALPGRIHRIVYEELVEDPDSQVRGLLDYLELPFDSACLRFHENERAVRTPSSEQVRQPINRSGIGQWRLFEPWLGPLKAALGEAAGESPAAA